MEAINDMWALTETCREAFEGAKSAPSAMQQKVSEMLQHIGLSVEDEVRCPKSGYSIDMIVHDSGGGSSSTDTWAVVFDGPLHLLTSRVPTGGWHSAEATASVAAGPRPRHRSLLGSGKGAREQAKGCST